MKNIARAFVVVLAFTGAAAAAHTTAVAQRSASSLVAAKATAFPIPTCPPDDPNGCGIAGPGFTGANITDQK